MPLGFYIHLNGGIRILALQNGAFKAGRICGGLNESEERCEGHFCRSSHKTGRVYEQQSPAPSVERWGSQRTD